MPLTGPCRCRPQRPCCRQTVSHPRAAARPRACAAHPRVTGCPAQRAPHALPPAVEQKSMVESGPVLCLVICQWVRTHEVGDLGHTDNPCPKPMFLNPTPYKTQCFKRPRHTPPCRSHIMTIRLAPHSGYVPVPARIGHSTCPQPMQPPLTVLMVPGRLAATAMHMAAASAAPNASKKWRRRPGCRSSRIWDSRSMGLWGERLILMRCCQ